jgi:hypothetical protein
MELNQKRGEEKANKGEDIGVGTCERCKWGKIRWTEVSTWRMFHASVATAPTASSMLARQRRIPS